MYPILLAIHSSTRWLVLVSLLYAIFRAYRGWLGNRPFTRPDNTVRHVTATVAHVQLMIGFWLYSVSPIIAYFLQHFEDGVHRREIRFFGMEHSVLMFTAVLVITVGSAKAKRRAVGREKFRTMAVWFSLGLLIILLSVPWPFSPFAARPYFRPFPATASPTG